MTIVLRENDSHGCEIGPLDSWELLYCSRKQNIISASVISLSDWHLSEKSNQWHKGKSQREQSWENQIKGTGSSLSEGQLYPVSILL